MDSLRVTSVKPYIFTRSPAYPCGLTKDLDQSEDEESLVDNTP